MNTKTKSSDKALQLAVIFTASIFLCSCNKGEKSESQPDVTPDIETSRQHDATTEAPLTMFETPDSVVLTAVFYGSEGVKKMIEDDIKVYGSSNPRTYTPKEMIHMTVPYVKRVRKGHALNGQNREPEEGVNLRTEKMLVYFKKEYLTTMLNENPGATGIIGIFATERDTIPPKKPVNQTIILVPFHKPTMQALNSGQTTAVVGYERWPTYVGLESLTTGGSIESNVEDAYDSLGIK